MTFERGIWQETARNFWANRLVVLTAIGLLMAVTIYENYTHSKSSGGIWTEFVWLPVAIAAHATILNGQSGFGTMSGNRYKSVFGPFFWRGLGLSFLGIIPATVLTISILGTRKDTLLVITLVAVYGAIESLILAKWGTMLPACVAEGDKSLKVAAARGSKTFSYVITRFWGCNAVFLIVGFSVVIFASSFFLVTPKSSAAPADSTYSDAILEIVELTLLAFNLVMLATILSRAYLIAEAEMKTATAVAVTT